MSEWRTMWTNQAYFQLICRVYLERHSPTPTSNSEWFVGVRRTPCTLWYPSGAWFSVRSFLWTSLHCPNATSHTSSSRVPSVLLHREYFKLVLRGGATGRAEDTLKKGSAAQLNEGLMLYWFNMNIISIHFNRQTSYRTYRLALFWGFKAEWDNCQGDTNLKASLK